MDIIHILRYVLGAILILSSLTLLGTIASVVFRLLKSPRAKLSSTVTILTGTLNAVGALWLGISGAQVVPPDEAKASIIRFYDYIEDRQFERAWAMIHTARKKEVKKKRVEGPDDFAKAYEATREYRNVEVVLDKVENPTSRLYWTSFDVHDRFPRNSLYQYQWQPLQKAAEDGLINLKMVISTILQDIEKNYQLPKKKVAEIERYLTKAPLIFVTGPEAVFEAASEWGQAYVIDYFYGMSFA